MRMSSARVSNLVETHYSRKLCPRSLKLLFTQADRFNSTRWWIDVSQVGLRTDITSLASKRIYFPSDTRILQRGCIWVSPGWDSRFNSPLPKPSLPVDSNNPNFTTYQTIYEMTVLHKPFQETSEFRLFRKMIDEGKYPYGLRSLKELHARGERIIKLWKSLETWGYQVDEETNPWDTPHFYITENGEISLGRHANHRVAFMRSLGIRWAPARIGGIHFSHFSAFGGARISLLDQILAISSQHGELIKVS